MAAKEQQNPETKNPVMPEVEKARLADGDSFWKSKHNLMFLLAILSITFGVYLPSLQNGFVNWDDGFYIYANPLITDISNWKSFGNQALTICTCLVLHLTPVLKNCFRIVIPAMVKCDGLTGRIHER